MSSLQRTREQERAKQAWEDVQSVQGKQYEKEYSSLVRGLSSMILANGLGQTLAFLRAKSGQKGDTEHSMLYQHLSHWVLGQLPGASSPDQSLLEWIVQSANSVEYRHATAEALDYLSWLRRFAEAVLKAGEE